MRESLPEFAQSEHLPDVMGVLILWIAIVLGIWFHFGEGILAPLNIAVSSILTGTLVVLYFKQAKISEEQASIMSLGYEPELDLENRAADNDIAYFEFKNEGPGTAVGVSINITTKLNEFDDLTYHLDLSRVDKPNVHSNVLEPLESGVYAGELSLHLPEELTNQGVVPFSEAARIIEESGTGSFLIIYHVEYTNALGKHQSHGFTYVFDIRSGEYDLERYFTSASRLSYEPLEDR